MSKMSQLHAELSESAAELGFETIQQAEEAGFVPNWNTGRFEKKDWLNEAHADTLKERDKIVEELITLRDDAADLAMGTGTHTDEWSKVALLADKVADYIKKEVS